MELTRNQNIKRNEDIVAYDICDGENYDLVALEDATDDNTVIKLDFEDTYILYAQWDEDDNEGLGIEGYWVIDTGDCH